jgi:DNA-binding PadR family transcriptional regulator
MGFNICSFSGSVADIPKKQRNDLTILKTLQRDGRISTWDMGEGLYGWIEPLEGNGLIRSIPRSFPFHYYELTEKGLEFVRKDELQKELKERFKKTT